jgi:peptidoglycan L-alanyl-D-glutamate endopeptidase CwlK
MAGEIGFFENIGRKIDTYLRWFTKTPDTPVPVENIEIPETLPLPPPTVPADLVLIKESICRQTKYLHPAIAEKLEEALKECYQKGLMVYVFESYRSPTRQQYLYDQGRKRAGKIITNAPPGKSIHQYCLAFDLVFDGDEREGVQWSWEGDYNEDIPSNKDYDALGEIMERRGFEWGARFKNIRDAAHFQMTYGMTVNDLRLIHSEKGIQGVWDEITKKSS